MEILGFDIGNHRVAVGQLAGAELELVLYLGEIAAGLLDQLLELAARDDEAAVGWPQCAVAVQRLLRREFDRAGFFKGFEVRRDLLEREIG